jgi:quercetin dioxygenase-like cupin family protein
MQRSTILAASLSAACAGMLLAACTDQPTSPAAALNAEVAHASAPHAAPLAAANLDESLPEAFTFRAPLDPYFINQAPDLMLRSQVRSDLAVQRLVTSPGEGAWHTHPGPSFGLVERGRVRIIRFTRKDGCTTEEYGPGQTYYEVAGEVHRADVLGTETAVEYKVRFNTPIGAPFGNPAADPGC